MLNIRAGCRTYDLRSGVWAFGYHDDMDAALPPDCTTAIACCALNVVGRRWTLTGLGLAIRDFAIDPLADVLVMVAQAQNELVFFCGCCVVLMMRGVCSPRVPYCVHVRRLSDGRPHELAAAAALDFHVVDSQSGACSFSVQLRGAHVGVLVQQDEGQHAGEIDCLGVWNWCTGVQEVVRRIRPSRLSDADFFCQYMEATVGGFDDFVFVDNRTFMLAVFGHPIALQVWRFGDPALYCLGTFCMPVTISQDAYFDIHFGGGSPSSVAGAASLDGAPFATSSEAQIITLSFSMVEPGDGPAEGAVACFTVVVRYHLMLEALAKVWAGIRDPEIKETGMPPLKWGAWGPACTRWLRQDRVYCSWEPCSLGGRYAIIGRHPDSSGPRREPQVIRIYDFRPEIVSRYRDGGSPGTVCVQPTVVPKGNMFVRDIVSELPYHVVTSSKELGCRIAGVMMDEGRLVCPKARAQCSTRVDGAHYLFGFFRRSPTRSGGRCLCSHFDMRRELYVAP